MAATRTDERESTQLRLSDPTVRTFAQLLVNVLGVSVTNFTVWFAITFFVYLETGSVFATGIIAGLFLVFTTLTGIWFGSIVDHHRKKTVMQGSAAVSLGLYAASLALYAVTPAVEWTDPASVRLWVLITLLMLGVIVGNLRSIALPTVVTALFDESRRDRANGMVGTTSGVSMLVTSVISGLLVGWGGMLPVLVLAVVVLGASLVHLQTLRMPELHTVAATEHGDGIDLKGTIRVVRAIPGMLPLIFFSTLNNLLMGAFMALMDPYGLSMVSVQAWGLIWGALSALMIIGGLVITRTGLSSNPVRLVLLVNMALWVVTVLFPIQHSVVLLVGGMAVFMFLMPYVEASEQTVLQKVVPVERQGRVFGFAQSVEQSASPMTAFLISPLAQFVFMPFMAEGGAGAQLIGSWFGIGSMRGVALLFIITALFGLVLTVYALTSKHYRDLSRHYRDDEPLGPTAEPEPAVALAARRAAPDLAAECA
jgi:DHA3 family multidrug efflux protein-like MFS transporter